MLIMKKQLGGRKGRGEVERKRERENLFMWDR